jgi:hypothetical protein
LVLAVPTSTYWITKTLNFPCRKSLRLLFEQRPAMVQEIARSLS